MSIQQKELPEAEHHLLLPRAHVHLFLQIITVVFGCASFIGGLVLYVWSFGLTTEEVEALASYSQETTLVMLYLLAGVLMGFGLSLLLGWAMWKFARRFRVRFTITFIVSVIAIGAGLLSVAIQSNPRPIEFTFYFFAITLGVLAGLLSLFYFFKGLARHIFRTHMEI